MTPQSTIAHYRIVSKLGEGGMGTVYRAVDTKLNRDVAVKILPPAFAQDTARLQRFEREARILASLNHPNIATIYGVEQGAIVMELVEGVDLAGPVPVDTAIAYANQIAAGLEAAHEKGIVHRDLKPANIKITPDGTVKLLDFGLAKAAEQSSAPSPVAAGASMSPTISLAMTQGGMILGTAAYMSPEQARGKTVDKRADIWAFGVVLYEMLTGVCPFAGSDSVVDILSNVVSREPDWFALPAHTPPHLRRLLDRCLRKDPKLRLRDIGDARIALEEPLNAAPFTHAPVARPSTLPWVVSAVLALALAAALFVTRPSSTQAVVRFSIVPGRKPIFHLPLSQPAISPDGRQLAYLSESAQARYIFVRPLDVTEGRPVRSRGASLFAWAPDSERICFLTDNQLSVVELSTGSIRPLLRNISTTQIAWGSQGVILLNSAGHGPLLKISESGGSATPATAFDVSRGDTDHSVLSFCPDGRHFLYHAFGQGGPPELRLGDLDSPGKASALGQFGAAACAAVPGTFGTAHYLLDLSPDSLGARTLDLGAGKVGNARSILASGSALQASTASLNAAVSVSANGTVAYSLGSAREGNLVWCDRSGRKLDELPANVSGDTPALSPDDEFVAVSRPYRSGIDIWVTELARQTSLRLQFDRRIAVLPVWSPDGARIAFRCEDGLCEGDVPRGGAARVLSRTRVWPQQYTADGRYILCVMPGNSLELIPVKAGDAGVEVAPKGAFRGTMAPGGGFISYTSNESGSPEVYVRAIPPAVGKWIISSGGGGQSAWRGDGKELFYLSPDGTIMAVDIRLTPFLVGAPHPLFRVDTLGIMATRNVFVVSRDGRRFLVYSPLPYQTDPVNIVLHWPLLLGNEISTAR